jgi:hypothetical protein
MKNTTSTLKATIKAVNPGTGALELAGHIAKDEKSGLYAFVYSADYTGCLDPINLPNSPEKKFIVFDPNSLPGSLNELVPPSESYLDRKAVGVIEGWLKASSAERLLKLGSRRHKGFMIEVGGNHKYGIPSKPDTLAEFDKKMKKLGVGLFTPSAGDVFGEYQEVEKLFQEWGKSTGQSPLTEVEAPDGKLWLVKMYDHVASNVNKAKTEKIAQELAGTSGSEIPISRIIRLPVTGEDALLQRRFDVVDSISPVGNDFEKIAIEKRTISMSSLIGTGEIHSMNYNAMARALEQLDDKDYQKGQSQSELLTENKEKLFRWSLLNHVTNNIDNHGRNIEIMIREDERWELAPVFDMNFYNQSAEMSTVYYGDPPKHIADILDDDFIKEAWLALDVNKPGDRAYEIRDSVAQAVVEKLPKIMIDNGAAYTEDLKATNELKHIVGAVGKQSPGLAKELMSSLKKEVTRELAKDKKQEKTAGMSR